MATERDGYYRYWGKAEGAGYHLLPYHCLDVAAVGSVLLREREQLLLGLARFLGVHADALKSWFTYCAFRSS
jgi:CRISPR-associated endonuclease/helicase Cas3